VTGLATKHRPRSLADLVGQRHVTTVLHKALLADRLPHQLLFSGGSGLGKTTVARVVAAALLCENPQNGDACQLCDSCLDIFEPSRIHPDVVEFDAASNGQKEQIRDLAARALTAPVRGKYRVYIIDEAHGLSQGGGQAFLKLLEEPPAHVVFMLATTDPDKMLRTNRGRCVEFELARPSDEDLLAHLQAVSKKEGWDLESSAARAVIQATDPALGLRGLLMTLEKLADLMAWGTTPSIDEVTSALGLAPVDLIDETWAAIVANDKQRALERLDVIRKRTSDASLRRALVDRARQALSASFATGASEIALWRFEQLLTTPAGQLWTDLAVAKIARSKTGEAGATDALLRDALDAAARLEETMRTAPSVPVAAQVAPIMVISHAEDTAPDEPIDEPLGAPASTEPDTQPDSSGEESAPVPSAEDDAAGPAIIKQLLELVAVRSRLASAILRTCDLSVRSGAVRIDAPAATIERLRAHAADVRAAAAEVGVTVTIQRPS
jgi:DNA polymerase-3 subunit gamma/tau